MILNNNQVPLILIIGAIGVVLGMSLMGIGPFNEATIAYNIESQATDHTFQVNATQAAYDATQTPLAFSAQQTAIADQLTAMPMQQTATQVAGLGALENAQINATQMAIAGESMNNQLAGQATQTALAWNRQMDGLSVDATVTAIAQGQAREQATGVISFAVVGVGALTLFVWIIVHAFAQAIHARAEEKMAQAQFLAEQRRMVSLRASLQNHNGHKPSYPVPNSLMKKSGDINKMPKV